MNIVLVEPEIPQNTGNIARDMRVRGGAAAFGGADGVSADGEELEAGRMRLLDDVEVVRWPCVEAFFAAHGDDELHLFAGQAACGYRDAVYGPDAFLLFGRESRGLDQAIIDARADRCRRIPMREGARSSTFPMPSP